jgi:hypothetical protein
VPPGAVRACPEAAAIASAARDINKLSLLYLICVQIKVKKKVTLSL